MTLVDPIGDMLTRIRNGQMRTLNNIDVPYSNFRSKILDVLKKEGYIIDFQINEGKNKIKSIIVKLKYFEGQPVIKEIIEYFLKKEILFLNLGLSFSKK